jgi:V8-like Glu-specific endopeptidase
MLSKGGHPFMVAVVPLATPKGYITCGSALVGVMTVVTAAHCVHGKRRNDIKVMGNVKRAIDFKFL